MQTIGIVIVSYNTRELLRGCLLSLRSCTLPLHIFVVDNGSHDGSIALVSDEFPEVELLKPGRNLGFAAANNLALQRLLDQGYKNQEPRTKNQEPTSQLSASLRLCGKKPDPRPPTPDPPAPRYILLLNPDTLVHQGALEALVSFLDEHPRVGAVGPRLLNQDGSLQTAAFRFPTLLMSALDLFPPGEVLPGRLYNSWWHGRYIQEQSGTQPFPIDHPLGACILIRRRVIEQVGLFDEQFFMYAEELDLCYRIRQAGWAIWQTPQAEVTHIGGASTRQFQSKMLVALYRSRRRFFLKHYSRWFLRWHERIVRSGILRATLRAWWSYMKGSLRIEDLRTRLWTYAEITKQSET